MQPAGCKGLGLEWRRRSCTGLLRPWADGRCLLVGAVDSASLQPGHLPPSSCYCTKSEPYI